MYSKSPPERAFCSRCFLMGLRKCENRSGWPRWSFVEHPFESAVLVLTGSIRRTAHPRFTLKGCGDDCASAARLRRADLSTTTCRALERVTGCMKCRGGRGCLYLIYRKPTSSIFSPSYGYVSNVLAKQELHVDRGMNRGESWTSKGARGASDMLESVTGLPKCRR